VNYRSKPRPDCSVYFFVPEGQRLHCIIECVVSADEMTSTPSKIISSSINNLTVWYGESGPISDRFHLFASPSLDRIPHIYQHYHNLNATSPHILFLLDSRLRSRRSGESFHQSELNQTFGPIRGELASSSYEQGILTRRRASKQVKCSSSL
jgi:hypothetical protein